MGQSHEAKLLGQNERWEEVPRIRSRSVPLNTTFNLALPRIKRMRWHLGWSKFYIYKVNEVFGDSRREKIENQASSWEPQNDVIGLRDYLETIALLKIYWNYYMTEINIRKEKKTAWPPLQNYHADAFTEPETTWCSRKSLIVTGIAKVMARRILIPIR